MKKQMVQIGVAAAVAAMALVGGCESGPKTVNPTPPAVRLSANNKAILVGESTTIFARTQNLLGEHPQIRWSTTMGRIEPDVTGSIARFTSDTPGVAIITAQIQTASGRTIQDQTKVTVNSIR